MTRYALSLAALILAAPLSTVAQQSTPDSRGLSEARLLKAEKNYLACLSSENAGLVESAIAGIARLQMLYPERAFRTLREQLAALSLAGPAACMRYKAHLAVAVLDNPALMAPVSRAATLDNDELFTTIADRLRTTLLGYSVQ